MSAVPSPQRQYTARSLLEMIQREGGRVYRMREIGVFVITENAALAQELLDLGGRPFLPRRTERTELAQPWGGYQDAPGGPVKWDIFIHVIPVHGVESIWGAAGVKKGVEVLKATT